ncbi:TonB-dependent receptor, plug [Ectothiorhodospira sp. PHS-1]|uniref:TonB-dependent receptor plug domain-containing protein n=1 Tax=Ectothiorhodospira sp. PHS-1 TaxID=519989 RepID=UPI00024A8503|nr:TonB-dependent receptor [Ectothiorhodospira sp. PHS-1]EHQ52804.1 TonB-dependent receptor, plug [Ectothiorhodospira sp. PHS-1]
MVLPFLLLGCALPSSQAVAIEHFLELSLEDLLQQEVISVSRRSQRLSDVAAAVHVVTAEDIRRSGARSLPEALRLAPGVDVARISADRWAVSIRSHTEYLSNKLMVLVDGRNAYSPNFSGVLWNTLQIPLENIDRIEVIRGPGGAVWGVNAVNGVINIITRSSDATHGTLISAGYGNDTGPFALLRQGGPWGEDRSFNVYLQTREGRDSLTETGDDHHDRSDHLSAGFRLDGGQTGGDWMMAGNAYHIESDAIGIVRDPLSPPFYRRVERITDRFSGLDLQAGLIRQTSEHAEVRVNASWSYSDLEAVMLADQRQHIVDLEFQQRLDIPHRHTITWGAGYRWYNDSISSGLTTRIEQSRETLHVASLFAQDEIALARSLRLTLGGRLDHNSYTSTEFQPTIRILWNMTPRHSLWTSLSRAKRIPSRGERTADYILTVARPGQFMLDRPVDDALANLPIQGEVRGNDAYGSERLTAFEAGYRGHPSPGLYLDLTAFVHRYDNLRAATTITDPNMLLMGENDAYLIAPTRFINSGELTVTGMELTGDWRTSEALRFQLAYSFNDTGEFTGGDRLFSSFIPRHIASLRSSWNIGHQVDMDLWIRHVDRRPRPFLSPMDAYTTMDLRMAWRPEKRLELSLVAQNLLDSERTEYYALTPTYLPSQTRRGFYGQVKLSF